MCTISSAIFNSRKLYIANGKNYHKKMNKMMKKITYERLNDVCVRVRVCVVAAAHWECRFMCYVSRQYT